MTYDPKKDDYEWQEDLSEDENLRNLENRYQFLYQRSKELWSHSIHAPGCEARAQYLESVSFSDVESIRECDEMDAWHITESMMEDHMYVILEEWIYYGSPAEAYKKGVYQWMLWATGFQLYDTYEIVVKWLDENDYDQRNDIMEMMCQDFGGEEF